MIDHFAVFSKTGTVLWSKTLCKLTGDPIDTLINRVLMEDRSGEKKFINDAYQMQWVFENKLDLVFVVVYQKILQLLYIEELLEIVKKDFIALFPHQIAHKDPVTYDEQFLKILKSTELKFAQKQTRSGPRAFNGSRKAKGVVSNTSNKTTTSSSRPKTSDEESTEDGNDSPSSDGKVKDKLEELENEVALRSQVRKMRTGPGRKAQKAKKTTEGEEKKKKGKQMTKWENSKLSKKEMSELDRSQQLTADQEEAQLREKRDAYIGEAEDSELEEFSDTDDESIASSGAESDSKESSWSFSNTRIGNFFNTVSGNKILTREDLEPVVAPMHNLLISKNVASEVADELCESVVTTLVGQRLESFTRVSTVVRKALEAALLRILTPKKSTDVLREILEAKAAGRAYSIVFVGVNGVGKSTSLSKVCYYLKSKGVKVLIAACDTFRSGAVEQLNQHAKVLDVPLFQKGYAKDPAAVAKEAVKYGTDNGFDCVLIDTAGRMQNNEPLMRALAKLVSINEPDLVLFVGEALVGNDGIDQLSMFDRALADYSDRRDPHRIDGIVITKFDTIDDKVGAAVSMVYKTGQPIMFVGTGQKYTHLKKLNVRTVLRHLLE
uniref:SRP54-type proteins GTP-binding domain-containing protein n=1 Tax=Globisporangium ultimum (strain ATCC 200006 / CBS 805.95 / DAOM BR144) TaxID=431595 RepID=K3WPU5_GLOUD